MTVRSDRIVLALEILLGVLPITIVGGGYSLLGLLFSIVSVFLAVREHAFNVFVFWLGILGLAASGLAGIVGLWAVIALSAAFRPTSSPMRRVAVIGSVAGVLAAAVVLGLMLIGRVDRRPAVAYILVAPILVVLHRAPSFTKS
jgi:ethanolamine transporter EutH